MKGLLVRVAADQSEGGGYWNGPADSGTGEFVYVAIPESSPVHPGLNRPYADLSQLLANFGATLPSHLSGQDMHLDPDFDHLTYGDQGERAKQIRAKVGPGDLLVFYAEAAAVNWFGRWAMPSATVPILRLAIRRLLPLIQPDS